MPIYTYTTIDDPLAKARNGTQAFGINASGRIVGTYSGASAGEHGFLYSKRWRALAAAEPMT
jgi:probable HAF family extracellular repeat protein